MPDKESSRPGKAVLTGLAMRAFTPGSAIDKLDLFAGRLDQIMDVLRALDQRGQHVVLYGERGVGKTSLANVLGELNVTRGTHTARLPSVSFNCSKKDDFSSIWNHVLRDLEVAPDQAEFLDLTPEDVRHALNGVKQPTLVIIDEVDRLDHDADTHTLLADTVKTLSDHSSLVTLVLVGVADSVEGLIGEHPSTERALSQVLMPRMSTKELGEIVDKGLSALKMGISTAARTRVTQLSEGLPHYTHLLTLFAVQRAIADDRREVQDADVNSAITMAEKKAQHTIKSAYQRATRSTRPGSLFERVLTACALADKDELGYFSAGAVREPMTAIMGKPYDIPAFARHLNEFASPVRGDVLTRSGQSRRYFYRFDNPMLQPYVILKAISNGLVTEGQIRRLQIRRGPFPSGS